MVEVPEVDVKTLLKSWGTSAAVIRNFIDEDVSLESLPFLSEATLLELVPKKGPRDIFVYHYNKWKRTRPVVVTPPDSSDEDDPPPVKRARAGEDCRSFLKEILETPAANELHKFLKDTVPGLTVLGYYAKNKELDHYSRDLLGQQVIYQALQGDYEKSITRSEFSSIADTIVELFPSESKVTWFDEVKKGNTTVLQGRLRFKYYAIRRSLYKANLICKKSIESELIISSIEGLQDFDISQLEEVSNLSDSTPWPQVEECWNRTRELRFRFRDAVTIDEYVSKFPVLQHNLGWTLLAEDGVHSQPCLEHIDNFWDEYSEFLVSMIRTKNKGFLKKQQDTFSLEEESKQADFRFLSIIKKVPDLFKVRTLPKSPSASKSDKKCLRPSASEVRDAFCLHLTDIALLEEKLSQRRDKLMRFKYTLQPIPVVVGDACDIKQCFIVLNNHRWEVDKPFTALFGVMKLCFGLNASYPIEACHAYLFLQQTMLKLNTPNDFKSDKGLRSFLAARVNDYNNYLKPNSQK